MALIGESDGERNLGKRQGGVPDLLRRDLDTPMTQIPVRRHADTLPEGA
jgi:hypothetical protein